MNRTPDPRPPRRDPGRRLAAGLLAAALTAALSPALAAPAAAAPTDWTSLNTSFVERDGARLVLDGETFRFSGPNIYWLGLDENVGGVDYPTAFRIADTLDAAARMGSTVVRTHMMTSTGQDGANPLAIMPSLGQMNEEAFATIDFAIAYAGKLGIRLVLPLTDEWEYYHGGHRDFTTPYGLTSADFYTDERPIAAYQAYVDAILRRTNALTGVRYTEDPTVMAWELGNELEGMTAPWIERQVAFIKERAPQQLVAAGRRFDIDSDTLSAPGLDIVDVHYYPPTVARVSADAATVTAAGKVYLAGEYASTAASPALLEPLVADPNVTGMLFWSLFGNNDRGGLVPHDDGFTIHAPGATDAERARVSAIAAYAAAIGAVPAAPAVGTPLITAVDRADGINTVRWRGAGGAVSYRIERTIDGTSWTPVETGALAADAGSATDFASPVGAVYRVVALDAAGAVASVSDQVATEADTRVLVDPLESWLLTEAHDGANITPRADGTRVVAADDGASVTWKQDRLSAASFLVSGSTVVESSPDGSTWETAATEVGVGGAVVARDLVGPYLRVTLAAGAELSRATIWSAVDAPSGPPAAFASISPAAGTVDVTATPTFTWEPSVGAAYYRLTLAQQADLGNPVVVVDGIGTTSITPTVSLTPGQRYWWSVAAVNGAGTTASSTGAAYFLMKTLPSESIVVDDFESYADDAALQAAYVRNTGGGAITPTLATNPDTGSQAMTAAYDLAGPGYAGIVRTFQTPQDWWGHTGLVFWVQGTPGDDVTVQFVTHGTYWETVAPIEREGWQRVAIPFSDFASPAWAGEAAFDPTSVTQLGFYLGGEGAGTLLVDDVATTVAAVEPEPGTGQPGTGQPGAGQPGTAGDTGTGAPASDLARTGLEAAPWIVVALALAATGGLLLIRARRRAH
ncbi:carbohydrate binding domain-containing protein [Plantibacter sp. ME-Dv--P-122b]|uniref:carbohydrate binding domain-containing protein n=1 Tax=Plantibacter sp. ME-Dv--P-122b TaxID=3040300 RepID=UPI00254C3153|nr:carbohydrate binding domain-containing protein [Plantibacter sp. ME-Dv--P-122b]